MLHRLADLLLLPPDDDRPLAPVVSARAADPRALEIGAQVRARVAALLPDGSGRVTVEGHSITLPLPAGCKPGDELRLTVSAQGPRLQLAAAAQDGAPHITTLSAAGRFIAGLFSALDAPTLAAQAAATPPLLPGPPADTGVLAARLRGALAESGLFYEAHQAQWIAGRRPLAELLREPQARTAPLPPAQEPATMRDATAADTASAAVTPDPEHAADDGVHPALHDVVRHQLEALDTGRLVWHGTMWPGQPARWEIAQQPSPEAGSQPSCDWQTDLKLTLPRLGGIGATITVGADGLRVALVADADDTADLLLEHGDELKQALRAAGAGPAAVTISREPAGHE